MLDSSRSVLKIALAMALVAGLYSREARADGTETLGTPSIEIATGSGFVAAGTGLVEQPGLIEFDIPAGEPIQQVLLYWSGELRAEDDDTIEIDGIEITGTLIGGPTYFYTYQGRVDVSSYRADITDLGLVTDGVNALEVAGLEYDNENAGAGILVVYGECGAVETTSSRRHTWRNRRRCNNWRWNRCWGHESESSETCADIQVAGRHRHRVL